MMQEIEIKGNIKWITICMKITLRGNLVHNPKDKWKKTNPVRFNIICLKSRPLRFHESYFILLYHFYYSHHPVSIEPNSLIHCVCLKVRVPISLVIPIMIVFGWCIYSTSIVKCILRESHSRFGISSFENQASFSLGHYKWPSTELLWGGVSKGIPYHKTLRAELQQQRRIVSKRPTTTRCDQLASGRHRRGLGSRHRQI